MAVQKGVDVLLSINTTGSTYVALGGARTVSMTLNNQPVDATSASSTGQWRQLINDAGIKSLDASFSGVFQDDTQDETLRSTWFNRTLRNFRVTVPSFGTFTGPFIVTSLTHAGSHDGEATFEVSLQSGGEITFASI
jgi:TP901-1 family phage major tail protein